jgi:hypothetical protein
MHYPLTQCVVTEVECEILVNICHVSLYIHTVFSNHVQICYRAPHKLLLIITGRLFDTAHRDNCCLFPPRVHITYPLYIYIYITFTDMKRSSYRIWSLLSTARSAAKISTRNKLLCCLEIPRSWRTKIRVLKDKSATSHIIVRNTSSWTCTYVNITADTHTVLCTLNGASFLICLNGQGQIQSTLVVYHVSQGISWQERALLASRSEKGAWQNTTENQ